MSPVFDYKDYKSFLRKRFPATGEGRGSRSRLAAHLHCQQGFVSQVLNDSLHFSPEHGIAICEFLALGEAEQEFFLLLLSHDRAGSAKLKSFYRGKIEAILRSREEIRSRIGEQSEVSPEIAAEYYGQWAHIAVHMACRIPRCDPWTTSPSTWGRPARKSETRSTCC